MASLDSAPTTVPQGSPALAPDNSAAPLAGAELLTELDLGSARGARRKGPPVLVEVLRSLAPEDLPALVGRQQGAISQKAPSLVRLRHSHHQLARLLASGVEQNEIALITGYSPSYISNIQNDPQFSDLVETYVGERELVFVDTLERMKALGLTCLEELQEQLAIAPEKWSRRELMELAELLLIRPARGPASGGHGSAGNGPAVAINVKFVGAPESSAVIDVTPTEVSEG